MKKKPFLNLVSWMVAVVFVMSMGGCGAQEAILTGTTAVVYGPAAAGLALIGGTAAGVGMAMGASATEEKISPEDPNKWNNVYAYKGLDIKKSGEWVVKEYKARKKTKDERDMLYLILEYRVRNNFPYPDAVNPIITVEEMKAKMEAFNRIRMTKKNPREYTFKDYLGETNNTIAQN